MNGAHKRTLERRTLERAFKVVQTKERLGMALDMRMVDLEAYLAS